MRQPKRAGQPPDAARPKGFLMCGRFTARMTWEELIRYYRLTLDQPPRNTQARYNICPTDSVDIVVSQDGQRPLISMRWGEAIVSCCNASPVFELAE